MAKARRAFGGTPPRVKRWASFAYAIAAFSVATTLYVFVRELGDLSRPDNTAGVNPLRMLFPVTFAATGALIASRRPANPIGWLFLFSAVSGALSAASSEYLRRAIVADGATFGGLARSFAEWGWVPLVVPVVAFVPMFFPDGRLLSARWRGMPVLALVGAVALAVGDNAIPDAPNPYVLDAPFWAEPLLVVGSALLLVAMVLAVASLIVRMRRGTPVERQQLKIFFYAAILFPAFNVAAALTGSLMGSAARPQPIVELLGVLNLVGVPVAVTIAVLRYRLYEIDLLIKRTIVYGATTASLATTFFVGIVALQALLRPLTSGSELAIAASTLLSFALFQPIRRRVQDAVDRRFDRSRYDASRALDAFANLMRDEVDLEVLRADLLGSVQQTMAPAHMSLWLRERAR